MTTEDFLDWAEVQAGRHEFDGASPVAMTGGTFNHALICQNIYAALRARLKGGPCRVLGPDAGVATEENAIRYPDALVTCGRHDGTARLIPDAAVVFEVSSPSSGRMDRIVKLREYRAVASIRVYVIVEHAGVGLTVFARAAGSHDWTATPLAEGDVLHLAALGIEVPAAEFYEGVEFAPSGDAAA